MFSQLRIGSKLLIGFGAILSLLMGVTALATFSAVRSSESLEKMATLKSAEVLEQRIEARLGEARLHFWIAFKSNGQSDDQTHWNASIEDFKTVGQWMNTLAAGAVDSDRAPIGQQMAGLVQRYAELVGKLHDDQTQIGLLPDEEVEKATADLTKIEIDVANQGAALASSYRTASEIMVSEREASSRLIEMIIIVSGIAGLFFGASLSVLFARSIGRPILAMVGVMKALAAGKLEVSIPNAGDRTELGEMARTIAIFRDSAVEKERLEAEAAQRRAIVDLDRQRNEEAQRAAIAHERAIVAESIGSGLSNLAAKNLTYRMTSHIPDAYLQLQTDFNSAIAQLETALSSVVTSADVIHADSREIMGATDELSSRTERQAANLEETVATLGEVTTAAKKAAAGTVHAHQVVSKAQSYARETDEVIGKAIAAMGEIEKSSSQIGQIVGMIEEIAFQTSLLALNAGVEAARVGDAGRGFAVVASEVRALSQRSAEAANEIKGLISNATKQVNSGVALVVETGKSLGQIMRQVKEINGVVTQIAAGASEQSSALEHINSAIIQIDQATQQNAAMVEQSTASSQSLAEEAEQLASLVGQFTVDVRPQGKATRVPTNEMRVAA